MESPFYFFWSFSILLCSWLSSLLSHSHQGFKPVLYQYVSPWFAGYPRKGFFCSSRSEEETGFLL
jgi:hypothetical protein